MESNFVDLYDIDVVDIPEGRRDFHMTSDSVYLMEFLGKNPPISLTVKTWKSWKDKITDVTQKL